MTDHADVIREALEVLRGSEPDHTYLGASRAIAALDALVAERDEARRQMAMIAVENLIAAFGFGRIGGHPQNLLNTELRCMLGCCI